MYQSLDVQISHNSSLIPYPLLARIISTNEKSSSPTHGNKIINTSWSCLSAQLSQVSSTLAKINILLYIRMMLFHNVTSQVTQDTSDYIAITGYASHINIRLHKPYCFAYESYYFIPLNLIETHV